jgi:hypothetical protein
MKKKLGLTAAFIAILCLAAIVFAEGPKKYPTLDEVLITSSKAKPQRPSVRPVRPVRPGITSSTRPGARLQGPGSRNPKQRARGLEAMIAQQTKRIEGDITRETKSYEAETTQLKAILKQANDEKAKKTAALINELITQKTAAHTEKITQIKKRVEDFKKRMERQPARSGRPTRGATRGRPTGGARPSRSKIPAAPRK